MEPQWLTGAAFPYYDPLELMITETHKGMEFHGWIRTPFSPR
jgi:uncharacterized lipoprotein YddW (UPF0748 family)